MDGIRFLLGAIAAAAIGWGPLATAQTTGSGGAPQTLIRDPAWTVTPLAATSRAASPAFPARLANVSVRASAGPGAGALIAGASVDGAGTLPVLVRAIGPGLAGFGVSNFLRQPQLEIYREHALAAQTNSASAPAVAASALLGAFPLRESTGGNAGGDAALLGQPAAGTLTAHCTAASGSGVALLEFYDASAAPGESAARFRNFSARAQIEAGEALGVVGFVITGEGELRLLLRAIGPSLERFNLPDYLRDPVMELYEGSRLIASNDNWRTTAVGGQEIEAAARSAGAFELTSSDDAAAIVTLGPGSYTLQVRDRAGRAGVALAEIYELGAGVTAFAAAESTNAVGLELFRRMGSARPAENFVLSPYSIESALALAYVGAEGETRREMARVLRLPDDTAPLQAGFAELRRALDEIAEQSQRLASARTAANRPTDPIQWHAANRLFGQQGYAFREAFLQTMKEGFAAPFQPLDFRLHTEPSRLTINRWVEEQTRQKIRDLIPMGGLTEDTRLVLVNALYLNAPWENPFDKAETTSRPFRTQSSGAVNVPTMQRTGAMGVATDDGLTVVTLDYLGGGLQCVIILPGEAESVTDAAARLTPAHFARWSRLSETQRREVRLLLPKFKVEGATVPLGATLRAMGMTTAFDVPRGSANFDRIAPRRPDEYLAISEVFHQTYLALDESGTEAAAATAVVIVVVTSVPPPPLEVKVDRPFLFAIQHRASGTCLFLGRISDPR